MRRRSGCLLAAVLVAVVGLWVAYRRASGVVERKIEQQVAAVLPSRIGPGTGYKVTASAGLAGAARGTIGSVKIEGRDVQLRSGIKLKRLDTVLKGIHVDREKRAITRIESAEFTTSIAAAELNSFLAAKYPDIPGRSVALHDGYLTLSAVPTVRGVTARIEARASLEIEAPDRLVLRVNRIASGELAVPAAARHYLEEKLNPVASLSDWGFRGQLKSVEIAPDAITLSGTGSLAGGL